MHVNTHACVDVRAGEADALQSYGLNVARLARLPEAVIQRAKEKSEEFEAAVEASRQAYALSHGPAGARAAPTAVLSDFESALSAFLDSAAPPPEGADPLFAALTRSAAAAVASA